MVVPLNVYIKLTLHIGTMLGVLSHFQSVYSTSLWSWHQQVTYHLIVNFHETTHETINTLVAGAPQCPLGEQNVKLVYGFWSYMLIYVHTCIYMYLQEGRVACALPHAPAWKRVWNLPSHRVISLPLQLCSCFFTSTCLVGRVPVMCISWRSRVQIPLKAAQIFSLKLAGCFECFPLLCLALLLVYIHFEMATSRWPDG